MEQQYLIKITGSGTQEDIMLSLKKILLSMEGECVEILDGAVWEDATLITEIKAI